MPANSVAPEWVLEPDNVEVTAGQPVSVHCSAFGIPAPTVTWIKIGKGNDLIYNYFSMILGHIEPFCTPVTSLKILLRFWPKNVCGFFCTIGVEYRIFNKKFVIQGGQDYLLSQGCF